MEVVVVDPKVEEEDPIVELVQSQSRNCLDLQSRRWLRPTDLVEVEVVLVRRVLDVEVLASQAMVAMVPIVQTPYLGLSLGSQRLRSLH